MIDWTTNEHGERVAARRMAWYDIFPISSDKDVGVGIPAWRWMATVSWYEAGDAYGCHRMASRRTVCPLRLMHWVYAMARRLYAGMGDAR